jgi:hypothetical protein
MTIAIDLDGTWTRDPAFWLTFYRACHIQRHTLIMVTGRHRWTPDVSRHSIPESLPIIYAGSEWKEVAARKAGYTVDVWIDDMPAMIQPAAIITPAPDEQL